eukprot:TRINITY_DN3599_c0_g1_i1.p1 TRINITY_DN3599_c0_g1~~TRINITY_DN3599_c0_g1_i1.p1  ORF type:complete len:1533 (-),score=573.08 TRINITY_DN3599_c0_g1_i1:16-4614(-)
MSDSEDVSDSFSELSEDDDFSDDEKENKPNKAKSKAAPKTAKVVKPKATKSKTVEVVKDSKPKSPKSKKEKSVEDTYKKLDQIEHALLRPDMYIGSCSHQQKEMWVHDEEDGMVFRQINFVPGLYKIFDEIVVNAADNKQRDPKQDYIKVVIDREAGSISVENDGKAIPIVMHKKEKMYIPELIFGTLLTGANFDDDMDRVTGGRNGLGAKLTNIFSKEFVVETVDSEHGLRFSQTYRDNLSKRDSPLVKSDSRKSFTRITFKPDFARFGMDGFDEDFLALVRKRVYDVAGCNSSLKVYLNGARLLGDVDRRKAFEAYCDLYIKDSSVPKVYEKTDRWEVCISLSPGEFDQVSFVNSLYTINGGKHVDHIVKQIIDNLLPECQKKLKGAKIERAQVKNQLWVFVNCLIVNPSFSSQIKEVLETPVKDFGSTFSFSETFLKKLKKTSIIDRILDAARAKQDKQLANATKGKKNRRLTGITKLDDANEAGGKHAERCTLILTEGDSAKTLAVSGLSVVGRDYYGVFPLRGKVLNVREAGHSRIMANQELTFIKQILGLKHGEKYEGGPKGLRYGHLMIMTDQDHDGSHIKGLLINFFHHYFPGLLKSPGFMVEFITPIVKAKKGKEEYAFYTIPEYKAWKESLGEKGEKGWTVKYYKGLGTSTSNEAKEYFSDLKRHKIDFFYEGKDCDDSIELAFSKSKANERKEWMRGFQPGTFLDQNVDKISYDSFINKELILFSMADCERSIPSVIDGLKPGQRKVLFSCFKRNLKSEIKVVQLAGYVSEHSAYHHGEQSLSATIINMAQSFVGSNNLNFLYPGGQFGSRLQGGKDAASPRYIFTKLAKLTRLVFHPDDDKVLNYLDDDGMSIEPEWYVPIIPTMLLNGGEGIGTGWSTFVPNYNPKEIVKNLKHLMRGEEIEPMHPWYRGFTGEIVPDLANGKYTVKGKWRKLSENTIEITELPIGSKPVWVETMKAHLESLITGDTSKKKEDAAAAKKGGRKKKADQDDEPAADFDDEFGASPKKNKKQKEKDEEKALKLEPLVKDFRESHTEKTVCFRVEFLDGKLNELEDKGIVEKTLKLVSSFPISNMHAYDPAHRIAKYASPEDVLKEFFAIRIEYYGKRKEHLVGELKREWLKLDNKVRFILGVVKEEIIVRNRKRADLLKELQAKKFDPIFTKAVEEKMAKAAAAADEEEEDEEGEESDEKTEKKSGYDYLLSMPLWNLTMEKVNALIRQRDEQYASLQELESTPIKTIWERDLDAFVHALDDWYEEEDREETEAKSGKRRTSLISKPRKKVTAGANKRKKDEDDGFQATAAKKPALSIAKTNVPPKASDSVAVKPAPAAQKKLDGFLAKETSAPEPKPAAVKKETTKPAPKSEAIALDSDEELNIPLSERIFKRMTPEKTAPARPARGAAKSYAFDSQLSDDEVADADTPVKPAQGEPKPEPAKKEPAKKEPVKKEPAKKEPAKPVAPKSPFDELNFSDQEPSAPARKRLAKKPAAKRWSGRTARTGWRCGNPWGTRGGSCGSPRPASGWR